MKQCNKCKTENNNHYNFCYNCGCELEIITENDIRNLIENSELSLKFKNDENLVNLLYFNLVSNDSINKIKLMISTMEKLTFLNHFDVLINNEKRDGVDILMDNKYNCVDIKNETLIYLIFNKLNKHNVQTLSIKQDDISKLTGYVIPCVGYLGDGELYRDLILTSTQPFEKIFHCILNEISPKFTFCLSVSPIVKYCCSIYKVVKE